MKSLPILILLVLSFQCVAGVEYKKFDDPEKEQAYGVLIEELRCLVCQNQTIADSNADLAKDLRRQVYEMLEKGQSRDEIVDFMIERYGDFVMYNPQFKAKTGVLWIAPFVFLLSGFILVWIISRKKIENNMEANEQQKQKKVKVKSLLDQGDQS
ncbi:MAG: cytochrome c-type biogenesis protein CcmH [Methylococcales symbiont of Hymedesmia sp. n. MRB-2018]|nr:MAG: cytochrome c-type biogenesis protein CcmH [Methylococcales symbiont of Hymedesmia sp. n. MRB-2018]